MKSIVSLLFIYLVQFQVLVTFCEGVILTCGQQSDVSNNVVDFVSPLFPRYLNEDLTCEVSIRLKESYKTLRIDFVNITMDGQTAFGDITTPGHCETDMFFFKGLDHWTPPAKCGNLNGYSYVYKRVRGKLQDATFKIVALMASDKYRWHIRITQVERRYSKLVNNYSRLKRKANRSRRPKLGRQRASPEVRYISEYNQTQRIIVPWLVSIRKKRRPNYITVKNCRDSESEGLHLCGGTIISSRFIVTAAHCFYGRSRYVPFEELNNIKVVVGDSNVCEDNSKDPISPSYEFDVTNVVFYYGYDSQLKFHDIAVIHLKDAIAFDSHITPIELNQEPQPKPRNGLISGYGAWKKKSEGYSIVTNSTNLLTEYFPYGPKVYNISISSETSCSVSNFLNFFRFDHFIGPGIVYFKYADARRRHICHIDRKNLTDTARPRPTDSGGPVVAWNEENKPILWGIILRTKNKFLYDDAEWYIFVSVSQYQNWIHSVMDTFAN